MSTNHKNCQNLIFFNQDEPSVSMAADMWTKLNLLSFSFKRTSYKILFPLACCYHIQEKKRAFKTAVDQL